MYIYLINISNICNIFNLKQNQYYDIELITSMSRDFKILLLMLVSNDLKCIKLSDKSLKYFPASNILGVGTKLLLLFLFK